MAELPLDEGSFEELEEDQILGRKYEGPWEKECSDEQLERPLMFSGLQAMFLSVTTQGCQIG
jgi:hypothetical protein